MLPAQKAGEHGRPQSRGDGARVVEASNDQHEEGAVATTTRQTVGTACQMIIDGRGLFRRKLPVQIFPESFDDLGTLHSQSSITVPADSWPRPGEQRITAGGSSA